MNYPKVIGGELYLCCNGIDYLLPDNILTLLRIIPGVTITNIRSIKVVLQYRHDSKSVDLLNSINELENTEENIFFNMYGLLCYGNPLKSYKTITPNQLDDILSYPSIYIDDVAVNEEDIINVISIMVNYQNAMRDLVSRTTSTLYYRHNIYCLHSMLDLFSHKYTNFFMFKGKLLFGNIMLCKEVDSDYSKYSREKLCDLYRLLYNFNPVKYVGTLIDINKYCNTYTEEEKDTLRKYIFDISFYGTDKPNKDTYGNIEFFNRIRVVNTNSSLMDFYEGRIVNIRDAITTINLVLSQ